MPSPAIDIGSRNFDEVVIRGSRERPVLVDFWAPWCGPCRTLGPILDKLAAEMAGRFTLVKLNTDDEQELAARYGIRGIPTIVVIDPAGVVKRADLAPTDPALTDLIDSLLKEAGATVPPRPEPKPEPSRP